MKNMYSTIYETPKVIQYLGIIPRTKRIQKLKDIRKGEGLALYRHNKRSPVSIHFMDYNGVENHGLMMICRDPSTNRHFWAFKFWNNITKDEFDEKVETHEQSFIKSENSILTHGIDAMNHTAEDLFWMLEFDQIDKEATEKRKKYNKSHENTNKKWENLL